MADFPKNGLLKVGVPKYLNTLPLLTYLTLQPKVEVYTLSPKKINELLEKGELDCGLASSLFYARAYKYFFLLPDLSISAVGKVKSVILYHRLPLSQLHQKIIGITPETETSFGLLRIVLEEFFSLSPRYEVLNKPLSEDLSKENSLEGYLAIGDEALFLQLKGVFPYYTDLAQIWLEKTGLPFVFALFIARKESALSKGELIRDFVFRLYLARGKGLSHLKEIVKKSKLPLEETFALNYLKHLEYDFSGLKQRAFLHFCELLKKNNILKEKPELNFFEL